MAEAGFVIIGSSARIVPAVVEAAQRGRNDFRIQNHRGLRYVFQNVRTIPSMRRNCVAASPANALSA
jgi:hypothetical protein